MISPKGAPTVTMAEGCSTGDSTAALCLLKVKRFFRKYFLQGQLLSNEIEIDQEEIDSRLVKFEKKILVHRKITALAIPFLFWQIVWWCLAIRYNYFSKFSVGYKMSITMIFGALIAGMTSEGGGAVAFPVMTLLLHIKPDIARDFSLMIQSCGINLGCGLAAVFLYHGMTAAAFSIVWMKVQIEWHSIIYSSLGGILGLIFGLEVVDPRLSPPVKKMMFVSIWFSFSVALFILNRKKKRVTHPRILKFSWWQMITLVAVGFLGGNFTAFSGSGVDICSFSFLTLLFYVSEKVATPTSVILMAINTVVGFFWREMMMGGVNPEAWTYLTVCVPIVSLCAPLGSLIASHLHRQVLASFIYVLELVALIAGFAIVKPGTVLSLISVSIIIVGSLCFWGLSRAGDKLYGSMTAPFIQAAPQTVTLGQDTTLPTATINKLESTI